MGAADLSAAKTHINRIIVEFTIDYTVGLKADTVALAVSEDYALL